MMLLLFYWKHLSAFDDQKLLLEMNLQHLQHTLMQGECGLPLPPFIFIKLNKKHWVSQNSVFHDDLSFLLKLAQWCDFLCQTAPLLDTQTV